MGHAQDDPQELKINLAEKANLDLAGLVQWLAEEKQMRITANTDQFPGNQNNKVVFYGDVRVSPDTMLDVVQSILRTNGFALVKSDVEGLYQVVQLPNVRPFAKIVPDNDLTGISSFDYVTGVFPLEYVTDQEAQTYVRQLVYASANDSTGNFTTIPNRNTLVITDTANRLARIKQLIEKLDVPADTIKREFYRAKNLQAEVLRIQLAEILAIDTPAVDPATAPNALAAGKATLKISAIARTNQLVLSGNAGQIKEALDMIEQLDVENQLTIKTYRFQNASAKQIDQLVRGRLKGIEEDRIDQIYQSEINEQSNQLIVTARDEIHQQILALKEQLDKEEAIDPDRSPMRFYSLKNVKASDLLGTLQAIERRVIARPSDRRQRDRLDGINRIDNSGFPNSQIGSAFQAGPTPTGGLENAIGLAGLRQGQESPAGFGSSFISDIAQLTSSLQTAENLIPGEAKVTVDENTNTLIVVADPQIQQLYAELIEKLDVRRPQVLIEVKLVTITGQDDLDLGLEISGGDRQGDRRLFAFSNFNLSTVDAVSGALALNPGLGFNGTLVDAATADVVLRALSRHRRARVDTAPRILVNDNATGLLSSVAEVPFETNNIGNTIATTSFGGFACHGALESAPVVGA